MKAQTARRLRTIHQYVGLFFTPAIVFFAFSGALQTIGLHENKGGGPPPQTWIRWMASVHKDQRLLRAEGDGPPKQAHQHQPPGAGDHGPAGGRHDGPSPVPLKAFVLLLSLGLIASCLLGVTIALTNRTARRPCLVALAAGVVVPVLLLLV